MRLRPLAVTDWRLRRWRFWFLALMTATRFVGVLIKGGTWVEHEAINTTVVTDRAELV